MDAERIERAVLALLQERGAGKTACPSEVARSLAGGDDRWRALMPEVRGVADRLAARGQLVVTQRGKPVSAVEAVGPIRLASPEHRR